MNEQNRIQEDQLLQFIQRIERLEEEKSNILEDIRDVYAEAKSNGFDVKILRKVIAIRKQDERERLEQDAILGLYLSTLGIGGTNNAE